MFSETAFKITSLKNVSGNFLSPAKRKIKSSNSCLFGSFPHNKRYAVSSKPNLPLYAPPLISS